MWADLDEYASEYENALFLRKTLSDQLSATYKTLELDEIKNNLVLIRCHPLMTNTFQYKINYRIGSNIFVRIAHPYYFVYRVHKPSSPDFLIYKFVVHIVDIGWLGITPTGTRIQMRIHPEIVRPLLEGNIYLPI